MMEYPIQILKSTLEEKLNELQNVRNHKSLASYRDIEFYDQQEQRIQGKINQLKEAIDLLSNVLLNKVRACNYENLNSYLGLYLSDKNKKEEMGFPEWLMNKEYEYLNREDDRDINKFNWIKEQVEK